MVPQINIEDAKQGNDREQTVARIQAPKTPIPSTKPISVTNHDYQHWSSGSWVWRTKSSSQCCLRDNGQLRLKNCITTIRYYVFYPHSCGPGVWSGYWSNLELASQLDALSLYLKPPLGHQLQLFVSLWLGPRLWRNCSLCGEWDQFIRFDQDTRGIGGVYGAGNFKFNLQGKGYAMLYVIVNGKPQATVLRNVLYVPDVGINLISIPQLARSSSTISKGGQVPFTGKKNRSGLYCVEILQTLVISH